ncbi:hypothetical protein BDV26DRAFT_289235 [Aspergillus bertholletiae]|uniref:Uncharacterized protein n=1 Tax=Aspergillus bertholletiae TaxID=1226010 RepID=A0A5N7BIK6_9EURO|nr:hypothetical protein BDV26DRAFT_289235 [Aspergillus bertholletiae]
MLFPKTILCFLAASATHCYAKAAFASTTAGLDTVQSHIEELDALRTQIDSFNGGVTELWALHSAGYRVLSGAGESRSMVEPMQNFTAEDENIGRDHLIRFIRSYTLLLHSVSKKTYIIKNIPYGPEYMRQIVDKARQEKDKWEEVLASKASPESYQIFIPDFEKGEMEYNNVQKALLA